LEFKLSNTHENETKYNIVAINYLGDIKL